MRSSPSYGYISSDEPGGSLKEVRLVLTIDGRSGKRGKKDLSDLADRIGTRDAKNRGSNAGKLRETMDCAVSSPTRGRSSCFLRAAESKNTTSLSIATILPLSRIRCGYTNTRSLTAARRSRSTEKEPIRQRLHGELGPVLGFGRLSVSPLIDSRR